MLSLWQRNQSREQFSVKENERTKKRTQEEEIEKEGRRSGWDAEKIFERKSCTDRFEPATVAPSNNESHVVVTSLSCGGGFGWVNNCLDDSTQVTYVVVRKKERLMKELEFLAPDLSFTFTCHPELVSKTWGLRWKRPTTKVHKRVFLHPQGKHRDGTTTF